MASSIKIGQRLEGKSEVILSLRKLRKTFGLPREINFAQLNFHLPNYC
jgi:hypothetical protein